MNNLHQAYQQLNMAPGSSFQSVSTRYKRLVKVWHPDRFVGAADKEWADEELKKINNCFDLLKRHLTSDEHRESGDCECRTNSAGSTKRTAPGAARASNARPGSRKRAADNAGRAQPSSNTEKTGAEGFHTAASPKKWSDSTQKRAVLTVVLVVFTAAMIVKLSDSPRPTPPVTQTPTRPDDQTGSSAGSLPTNTSNMPLKPKTDWPGSNLPAQQTDPRLIKKPGEELFLTRMEIDREQRAITACRDDISKYETKLSQPGLSDLDRKKAQEMIDFQRRNLQIATDALALAKRKASELEAGNSAAAGENLVRPAPMQARREAVDQFLHDKP